MAELEASLNHPFESLLTEKRLNIAAICMALFAVTFGLYWFLGPQETAYPHQVNQANNIIHGHLNWLPEYSKNFNTLERVMYDGTDFCFAPGDPEAAKVENPRFSSSCKVYMQHSLGPAFIVIPGVLIWGDDLNQTLVSVIFGAMTAPIVFLIAARFSSKRLNQLVLTGSHDVRHDLLLGGRQRRGLVLRPHHGHLLHVRRDLLGRLQTKPAVSGGSAGRGLHVPADADRHRPLLRRRPLTPLAQAAGRTTTASGASTSRRSWASRPAWRPS